MSSFLKKQDELVHNAYAYLKSVVSKNGGSLTLAEEYSISLPIVRMENCGDENWPYAITELSLDENNNLILAGVIGGDDRDCYDDPDEEEYWNTYNVAFDTDILDLADFVKDYVVDEEDEEDVANSEDNGWSGVESVIAFIMQIGEYGYELESCIRGECTNCTTNEELAQLLRSLKDDLDELADDVERLPEQIGKR